MGGVDQEDRSRGTEPDPNIAMRIVWKVFPVWVLVVGVLLAAGYSIWAVPQILATQGLPVESVRLISYEDREPPFSKSCGRYDGIPGDYTFKSDDPPKGFSAEFTIRNSCGEEFDVGDTATIVRKANADGSTKYYVDPPLTWIDAVIGTLLVAVGWLLLYLALRGLRRIWLRYFWRAGADTA